MILELTQDQKLDIEKRKKEKIKEAHMRQATRSQKSTSNYGPRSQRSAQVPKNKVKFQENTEFK